VSKAKEAPNQTVPAGATGDQSAEAAPQADENQAGAAE
jgi:hypothetical protein